LGSPETTHGVARQAANISDVPARAPAPEAALGPLVGGAAVTGVVINIDIYYVILAKGKKTIFEKIRITFILRQM
jgi:hypothetical protein